MVGFHREHRDAHHEPSSSRRASQTSVGGGSAAIASLTLLLTLLTAGNSIAQQRSPGAARVAEPLVDGGMSGDASTVSDVEGENILNLDIDELGRVDVVVPAFDAEVTSVARRESTVGKSPAAVFVVTADMIRRRGATSLPEVLRMVPGLNVARIDSNKWAITSRGLNGQYANKLLVLIDGRSVYTPTFAGVYWDIQDTLLQDIERIEVIRGPGATVWGANAVNGVINIITKKAQDTQGTLVMGGGGSEDRIITGGRHGGQLAPGFYYRMYGKYFDRDTSFDPNGTHDDWHQGRVGFRADWNLDSWDCNTVTFQGDYYQGASGHSENRLIPTPPFTVPNLGDGRVRGLNLLGRWTHKIDSESNYSLQMYYDRNVRNEPDLEQEVEILDVEWLHQFPLSCRHDITWGLRYRYVSDQFGPPSPFRFIFDPASRQTDLYSAFVQDHIAIVDDVLDLTVGCKFEHNDFTGFEYQPTARLLWTVDERRVAWASLSRAVRTPARIQHDLDVLLGVVAPAPPTFLGVLGNLAFASEELIAYEIGFRAQPTDMLSWDVALFFKDYSNLFAPLPAAPFFSPPALIIPFVWSNAMSGETYGVELSADYQMTPCWRVSAWYSFLQIQMHALPASALASERDEGLSPHHTVFVQSSWDLSRALELDLIGRYVDSLPAVGVRSYISLDARLGWRPNDAWEFSVAGQNLLEARRLEFDSLEASGTEVERGVYAQAVWRR